MLREVSKLDKQYDLTIVGGGPAGIFAGFYAGLREASAQLIESLPVLGGQVSALYPEKRILDVAGIPDIQAQHLIDQQLEQFKGFPIDVKTNQTVTNIEPTDDGFTITTSSDKTYSKNVVIAVGNGSFSPRPLAIDNVKEFEGKSLFYAITDLSHFKNHRVLIAGGGDSALDEALMLEPVAKEVHLVHRRNEFRALEHTVGQVKDSTIDVQTPYMIKAIEKSDDGMLVTIKKMRSDDETETLEVDDVIVSYGFTSDHKTVDGWNLDLATDHRLFSVNTQMETSVPGIYAIGDSVTYPGKQALIATAYGEAPIAINSIMAKLYPDRRGPMHSSSIIKQK
ncbi:NAD(P)/FAD-dependent oxidoreductase [Lactobacillus sp. LC28-10]|uniref:Ferredoxin--NADP reductase n=1 Tax=Secundilactobacillus angelensis TaxID=2722706 RepID=A0ABX1KYH1_9LACO|nr:NAD(P)/FAD-dependent oxidoreductase [Secundilactobacillus angelensis]MCH5462329.1 NAD(P)/FAD-dependent oxidoreductase [Secundilactobacillus angelensis]NLR18189.1 NAD(P)/FAD-dependent oxidoreductase [Secundilactobacillus angelensis]